MAWLTPMFVRPLVTAMATRGRVSTAATRLRWRVHVTQNRPSRTTRFMMPTAHGSPFLADHPKQHSVCRSSSVRSRSAQSVNRRMSDPTRPRHRSHRTADWPRQARLVCATVAPLAHTDNRMSSTDPHTGMIVLEAAECWRLLREADVGRLAVTIADHPDIFPINHVVDGETVLFRTLPGTKLSGSVLGRSVAFEVDGYDSWSGDAWSVVVKGRAVELSTAKHIARAQQLPLFTWWTLPNARWVQVQADEVSGRRFHVVAESEPNV